MAVGPAAPGDLKAEPGGDRNVVLSWQRNSEPDILYYRVSRKDGGGNFSHLGDVRQPASGRPGFTDTTTSRTPGGDFAYRVVAVRKGASGDDTTTLTSRASGEKSVTVAPPPTTVAPGTPGAEIKPAGTDTNIAGYLAGQPGALPGPKPMFIDLPDTGFEGSLPFGQLPGEEDMSEPGEEDAIPATLETRRLQEFNRGRPLIPIAAGAILLLLAAHLRLFNKRLKTDSPRRRSSAAEFIASLDASKHAAMELDVEAAVANGGHHRTPSGATLTSLPEWGQFRGVTLLPAAPEEVEDEDDDEEAWAESAGHAAAEAEAEGSDVDEEAAELDGGAVAEDRQALHADPEIDEEDDEDDFVAELEPWGDDDVAELEAQHDDDDEDWDDAAIAELEVQAEDVKDWDDEAEREAWGEEAVAELQPAEEADLLADLELAEEIELLTELELAEELEPVAELERDEEAEPVAELERDEEAEPVAEHEPDVEPEMVAAMVPDEMVAELEQDEDEDDEMVADLVGAARPAVITEQDQDENDEIVADLVGASGPVVTPSRTGTRMSTTRSSPTWSALLGRWSSPSRSRRRRSSPSSYPPPVRSWSRTSRTSPSRSPSPRSTTPTPTPPPAPRSPIPRRPPTATATATATARATPSATSTTSSGRRRRSTPSPRSRSSSPRGRAVGARGSAARSAGRHPS